MSLLLLFVSGAHAQGSTPLAAADRVYETGDIDGAIQSYQLALQVSGNEVEEVLHIHRRLGLLHAATGNTEQARNHFAIAIAIAPDEPALSELSPENRAIWNEVRDRQRPVALELSASEANPSDNTEVRIAVSNTPRGAVGALRVFVGSSSRVRWETRVSGVGPHTVLIPPSAWGRESTLRLQLQALDPHGGAIAEIQSSISPGPTPEPAEPLAHSSEEPVTPELSPAIEEPEAAEPAFLAPPPEANDEEERSIWASPWLWAITGVVVAGVTTTAVVLGSSTVPRYGAPTIDYGASP